MTTTMILLNLFLAAGVVAALAAVCRLPSRLREGLHAVARPEHEVVVDELERAA